MPKKSLRDSRTIKDDPRVLDTFITRNEKILLRWMVARLPAWMSPDGMTAIGVLGSLIIFIGYFLTRFDTAFLWLATFGFVLNWYGDSLDGTLARFRKIERPRYGFFVDHILDAIGETFIFVGLGLSPFVRYDLALMALVSYLLGSLYVYINTYISGVFKLSYGGFSPTEFRLIAIAINTVVFFFGNPIIPTSGLGFLPVGFSITLFDIVVLAVTLVILYLFLFNASRTAKALAREEH
jgi:phosphatidylglycerophosphate synthase